MNPRCSLLLLLGLALPLAGCPHAAATVNPPLATPPASPEALDAELAAALESAGVAWERGAGRAALIVDTLACAATGEVVTCDSPRTEGSAARGLVAALVHRGVEGVGAAPVRYQLGRVACSRPNPELSGGEATAIRCEVARLP